jgi:serine/threonine protein kinase
MGSADKIEEGEREHLSSGNDSLLDFPSDVVHELSDSQIVTHASDNPRGAMRPLQLEEGTELAGKRYRYRLLRKLGHGGFGSVYLAETLNPDTYVPHQVVLKFYHVPQTGDQRSLFRREVSSLLALKHDRIIRLYDWRFAQNACFLALEYYPAGSLLDTEYFLGKHINEETLSRVVGDLLTALNAAHQASILHLDIKPANVLRDAAGGYVLTDFGISQGTLVSHYMVETGVGSPGYQAPEQRECNRRWIGPRTDLYGVGATAWSLFTGQRLDHRPEFVGPVDQAHGSALPLVSSLRDCPPDLEHFIARMTAFDPAKRPGGAAEALALLQSSSRTRSRIKSEVARLYQTGHPQVTQVIENLVDPLWASICSAPRPKLNYLLFHDEDVLCAEGEHAYHTYVLMSGTIRVELSDGRIIRESREGSFLGENATLTGQPRTATLVAEGDVWVLVFNAAEFEQFVVAYPAVAIRLIKTLALRCRMNTNGNFP